MSMLAAPRRKQKWTLNPRGKQWSEDSSKFGQKLLEKMGWSSGKGLGAKEQGMTEHVRVRVKNDQVGIGYSKDRDNQWTEHQDDFNSFLQNLQKETFTKVSEDAEGDDKVLSGKSLEEKSKHSQKRVHYKKFTRGKDVNKYSTKDLANIFGKKDLNEKPQEVEEEEDSQVYDPIGTKDMTAGVITIKGGNMNEYFSKKFVTSEYSKDRENSESETETRAGFGFSQKSKSTFYVNDDASPDKENSCGENDKYKGFGFVKSSETKAKNKKLSNLNYVFDNPCLDLNILDNSLPKEEKSNDENLDSTTPKKRKNEDLETADKPKSKKQKKEYTYENEGLDLEFPDNSTTMKNEIDSISEKTVSKKSKKDKKSKHFSVQYENQGLDLEFPDNSTVKTSKNIEVPSVKEIESSDVPNDTTKKSKKGKKLEEAATNGIENPALDLNFPDRPTPKKSKKNKNFENSGGIENPGLDLEFPDKSTPKKSKQNKETKVSSNGIENPALDLNFPDNSTPSKTKRKRDFEVLPTGIENPALDLEFPDKPTPKKQKKNKNEIPTNGLENPALDLSYPENEIRSTTDFEVPRVCGVENNALNLSDEGKRKKRVTFNDEIEFSTDSVNKKKKKLDKYEVVNDKAKKKKSKEPVTFVNEGLDVAEVINIEEIENEINEKKSQKCKRKRDRRMSLLETIEEASEEENSNVKENGDLEIVGEFPCDNEDFPKKKSKKKKKKNKEKESEISEINESVVTEENVEKVDLVEKETKKKKKKKNKSEASVDLESNGIEDLGKKNVCADNKESKDGDDKKKKKKKKSDEEKISLEEFFKEDNIQEKETESQKPSKESDFIIPKPGNTETFVDVESNGIEDPGKENVCADNKESEDGDGKKKKKKKKSDEEKISLEEFIKEDKVQEKETESQKPSKESDFVIPEPGNTETNKITESNDFQRTRSFRRQTPKQIMKAWFLKNPVLLFNGSNINEIKGYATDILP